MNFVSDDRWRRDRLAVFPERLDVKSYGLVDKSASFVESIAAGDATGKVGDVSGKTSIRRGLDYDNIFHNTSF